MKLVIDANAVISAFIADSKTRKLIVTLEPDILSREDLTLRQRREIAEVLNEITIVVVRNNCSLLIEKSG